VSTTPKDEAYAAFKRSELQRWNDGECAGRVAEARHAALTQAIEAVEDVDPDLGGTAQRRDVLAALRTLRDTPKET
jgi:hypothetical protein